MEGYLAIFKKFHKLKNRPLFSSVMIHFAYEPEEFFEEEHLHFLHTGLLVFIQKRKQLLQFVYTGEI